MITRDALAVYLQDYLSCSSFKDYAPNGLQVEGKPQIQSIVTAVTASLDVIDAAIDLKADALLVHHGYFWSGESAPVVGMKKMRLARLLTHDINLFAYHLPLDCHPILGNNARIGQLLGVNNVRAYDVDKTPGLLWIGEWDKPQTARDVTDLLTTCFNRKPLHIAPHDKPIQQIAWCSGGAQSFLTKAYEAGADAYISGEVSERTYYEAQELGIHYFAAGHHATEREGIQALGAHLARQFGLLHQFIDSANPI